MHLRRFVEASTVVEGESDVSTNCSWSKHFCSFIFASSHHVKVLPSGEMAASLEPDWEITDEIKVGKELGHGSYGRVCVANGKEPRWL